MRLAFDIETDNLLEKVTKVHSLVIIDVDSGQEYSHHGDSIDAGLRLLSEADEIGGHNIWEFDLPALQKLRGWVPAAHTKITDTLTLSRLMYPDIKDSDYAALRRNTNFLPGKLVGRHSLKAWGYRLGELKGEFGETTDWSQWTPEMQAYCEQDVRVTVKLYKHLAAKNYSPIACDLEQRFARLISMQQRHGFAFNVKRAVALQQVLVKRKQELTDQLQAVFPPTVTEMKTPEYYFAGEFQAQTKGNLSQRLRERGLHALAKTIKPGPLRKRVEPFNPGSRDEIALRLKALGWKPMKLTDTGKPVVSETELAEVAANLNRPEAALIAEYLMIQKRLGQIAEGDKSWLRLERNGRIHGRVVTNGAVTGRCTHYDPNVTQTPAASSEVPYGVQCREVWEADPGFVLVGADASGLELRCLGHYMALFDGGEYAREVVEGDVHMRNTVALGLAPTKENRNQIAKRFIYAYLYGAGNHKLGKVAGVSTEETARYKAEEKKRWAAAVRWLNKEGIAVSDQECAYIVKGDVLRTAFEAGTPALKLLKAMIYLKVETPKRWNLWKLDESRKLLLDAGHKPPQPSGYLVGVDGRILKVRSAHSALNTLLQSAGAIAVKMGTVLHHEKLTAEGYVFGRDYANVAHVHDEVQVQARPEIADRVGQLFVEAIQEAGQKLGFRCPLSGEFKVGANWAETH